MTNGHKHKRAKAIQKGPKRKPRRPAKKAANHGRVLRAGRQTNPRKTSQEATAQVRRGPVGGDNVLPGGSTEEISRLDGGRGIPGEQGDSGIDRGQGTGEAGNNGSGEERDHNPNSAGQPIIQQVEYLVHLPETESHPKQHNFIYSKSKRKIARAGRRGGKTTAVAILAVEEFLKGHRVLYAVPTTDQLTRFWHEVVQALAEPLEYGVYRKGESDKVIELRGSEQRIKGKTAWNADSLRGDYCDVLILDEFQLMSEEVWDVVGEPMLIDNDGDAIMIYTPASLHSRSASKANDKRHASKMYKRCEKKEDWQCFHWTSRDNPHVSREGIERVAADMTEIARRQEIEAEDLDEVPGALWKLETLEQCRVPEVPEEALPFSKIVVAVDPTGSTTNEAGIVGAALGKNGHGYLLADESELYATPRSWGQRSVWLYWELKADSLVGERNYGGDMIRDLIATIDENVHYIDVTATKGKDVRAQPISALYQKGFIHHVGKDDQYAKLEEELTSYVPILSKTSPNRMDALVWAFTELFPRNQRLALVEQAKEMQATAMERLQKPMTNEKTLKCPECDKASVVQRGPLFHCTNCGCEWGLPKIKVEYDGGEGGPRGNLMK